MRTIEKCVFATLLNIGLWTGSLVAVESQRRGESRMEDSHQTTLEATRVVGLQDTVMDIEEDFGGTD